MKKKIIYGCEDRGDYNDPYLTRYTLFECKYFQICLHVFYRSDATEHHDHPWNFLSIILWRGYLEETSRKENWPGFGEVEIFRQKRYWPGMVLFRKATHRHRVVLKDEKKAVTLVIMGKYVRPWGFFTSDGWEHWLLYFKKRGC